MLIIYCTVLVHARPNWYVGRLYNHAWDGILSVGLWLTYREGVRALNSPAHVGFVPHYKVCT